MDIEVGVYWKETKNWCLFDKQQKLCAPRKNSEDGGSKATSKVITC